MQFDVQPETCAVLWHLNGLLRELDFCEIAALPSAMGGVGCVAMRARPG